MAKRVKSKTKKAKKSRPVENIASGTADKLTFPEPVPLRKIWKREDVNFTRWLAEDKKHLQLLGDAVGLELELMKKEKNVGTFRADILCKIIEDDSDDSGNTIDSLVLIENQIVTSDHKHLGQLLTYAAGLKTATIIWVAEKFTVEHRSALDWLNEITDNSFRFFGLEIELWKINGSKPAPKFNLISRPNSWRKNALRTAARLEEEEVSEYTDLLLKYWTKFFDYFSKEDPEARLPSPSRRARQDIFTFKKTGVFLRTSVSAQKKKIFVGIHLDGELKEKYNAALREKENIEKNLEGTLEWKGIPEETGAAIIKLEITANINNEKDWSRQHEWFKNQIEKFTEIFNPIVKDI